MRVTRSRKGVIQSGSLASNPQHAVRLDVRLVDDVQAVSIAEIVEIGIVGIVARAHGVEVILLHQADVGLDVGTGDRFARAGVVVVAVDAVEFHRNAVNKEFFAADLDFAKTHTDAPGLDDRALRVAERQHERIEVRSFGRPAVRGANQPLHQRIVDVVALGINFRHDLRGREIPRRIEAGFACRIEEFGPERPAREVAPGVVAQRRPNLQPGRRYSR